MPLQLGKLLKDNLKLTQKVWSQHEKNQQSLGLNHEKKNLQIVIHLCRFSLAQPPGLLQQWVWQMQHCQIHLLRDSKTQEGKIILFNGCTGIAKWSENYRKGMKTV